MTRFLIVTAMALLLALCPAGASGAAAATLDAGERIPILAWGGPPADQTTPERYRELADAGFTHNFSGQGTAEAMAKAMDVAQGAGIKQLLSTNELESDPAGTAARFKDHPALGGYYLRDEPGADLFDRLGKWTRQIQAVDAKHPCYVNLFPNYATADQLKTPTYQAYLDAFVKSVPVPMLSFDHYPVIAEAGNPAVLRGEWYDNLERAAAVARREDRPLWAFALSVAHGPYPIAEVPHLRVQAFSNLAYGAQVIQYFTYWTSPNDTWNFHEGPIGIDGKRTPVYDRVKQVNAEIQAVARVFLGSTVTNVGHTGENIPTGTKRYEPATPVAAVETEGEGAVVSVLEKGRQRFLVVVNRDIHEGMPVTVRLERTGKMERIGKDGSAQPVAVPVVQEQVEPGDVFILQWEER